MENKIFIPYEEVHSGDGKYFPTMDHIPEEYVKLFDTNWEESRKVTKFTDILNKIAKNYIPRTAENVSRLQDVSDVINEVLDELRHGIWYLVHQYMMYNENRPEIYFIVHIAYSHHSTETRQIPQKPSDSMI